MKTITYLRTIIWKARFALRLYRVARLPFRTGWEYAGAWMEMLNGDVDECPIKCADEEIEEWRACV